MTETQSTGAPAKKPEPAVLQDSSLQELSKEVAPRWMHMALYLSMSNTAIVKLQLAGQESGSSEEDRSWAMLQLWKNLRATAKDKDKVLDLERALREMDKPDVADMLLDRHRENLELTPECFA